MTKKNDETTDNLPAVIGSSALELMQQLAQGDIDEVRCPADAGSWLPQMSYSWPISQVKDPENLDKKGNPVVSNHRLFIGNKTKPSFLGEGDIIVPYNSRDAFQYCEKRGDETLRYTIGIKNGERKGADYQMAVEMIEKFPGAKDPRHGKAPVIATDAKGDTKLEINEGVSALVCVIKKDGSSAFVEMCMFKKLFKACAPSFKLNGIKARTGLRLKKDDFVDALTTYEDKEWPAKEGIPHVLEVITLDDSHFVAIANAVQAAENEINDWRKK
jgi:hypothetical protein